MKIFIDTEFTSFENTELISIGLVAENNKYFYKESKSFNHKNCSSFVTYNILPLLQGGECSVSSKELKEDLLNWLNSFNEPIQIVGDYEGDWKLFYQLLDGEIPNNVIGFINVMTLLSMFFTKIVGDKKMNGNQLASLANQIEDLFSDEINKWFINNNKVAHHALDDAKANMHSYYYTEKMMGELFI